MKINTMIRVLIAFYISLIFLVSSGIYMINIYNTKIDEIRENRYSILEKTDIKHYTQSEKTVLYSTQEEISELQENIGNSLLFIFIIMAIATFSFFFTFHILKTKILEPIEKMNNIIIDYQNGKEDVKEFPSNDDEIGLMIKEFFIMKRMHDEDYAKIEKLSVTDPLTGILNRRAFFEISENILKLSLRNKEVFSIMILDIDFFKKVNDVYGHVVGDDILKHFVLNVSREIRDSDILARFGGEEFIIMLPETDSKGAFLVAQKIREKIQNTPYNVNELTDIPVTVSIGIAQLGSEKLLRDLIHKADEALYGAKEKGRNRVEISI